MELLEEIVKDLPTDLKKVFKDSYLFKKVKALSPFIGDEDNSGRNSIEGTYTPLFEKMENLFQELLEVDDILLSKEKILEGIYTFSNARGAILLLEKKIIPHASPLFSFRMDKEDITFSCGYSIEMDPEKVSQERIKDSVFQNTPIFEKPFLYLPLVIKDSIIGEIILRFEEEPEELLKKIIGYFAKRTALMLDRLYRIQHSRKDVIAPFVPGVKLTDQELRFLRMGIIGHSEPMQKVYELVERIASLEVPVLLQGETGTGKELFARAIHLLSPRRDKKFLAINCAAMPEGILDSELFGYLKGAFTGAHQDHPGLFEIANEGTLFMDEIEEMSQEMQKKLLRAIQDGEIRRLGSLETTHVNTRIIAATNKDIKSLQDTGKFRKDLLYRLDVGRIYLPPLRDRKDDIPLLVEFLLARLKESRGISLRLDHHAIKKLSLYNWPGNVRELENLLTRLAILGKEEITAKDIEFELDLDLGKPELKSLEDMQKEFLRYIILKTLQELGWNIPAVCKRLSIPRSTLYRKLKELGIPSQF
jgi:DNA-binding NtrC family response regulator